jgi:hypothetical protein
MTDRHPTGPGGPEAEPPEVGPLDELASAILDGDATEAELARADEPEVARRVARFSALAEQVRQGSPGPDDRREAAIAAALAEFGGEAAPADELAARRERRGGWADPARRLRILGAAAAAIVAIAVGAVVLDSSPDDDQTTAADAVDDRATEETASSESSLDAETPASDGQAADSAGGAEVAPAPIDLGEFESADQLLDEALSRPAVPPQDTSFGAAEPSAAARCADPTGGATRIDTAELDGRAVLVYVRDDAGADGDVEIVVVDAATCEVLARRGP